MTLRERYFVGVLGWVKEVDQALNLEVYRERVDGPNDKRVFNKHWQLDDAWLEAGIEAAIEAA